MRRCRPAAADLPFVNCLCGAKLEADDAPALQDEYLRHTREAHSDLNLLQSRVEDGASSILRTGGWDGEREELSGEVEVRPLTPALADDYVQFFDRDAFKDNPAWASCYCLAYHVQLPPDVWEAHTASQNRADKLTMIRRGEASGVLAYSGERVIGWCNASPRSALPVLDRTPEFRTDEDTSRAAAIVCFVIAPMFRGQGVARKLLAGACDAMRERGFAHIDAFPPLQNRSAAGIYHGTLSMYEKAGFERLRDAGRYAVVRKML